MVVAASTIRDHMATKRSSEAGGEWRFGRDRGLVPPLRIVRNSGSSTWTRTCLAGLAPRPLRFPAVMPICCQLAAL